MGYNYVFDLEFIFYHCLGTAIFILLDRLDDITLGLTFVIVMIDASNSFLLRTKIMRQFAISVRHVTRYSVLIYYSLFENVSVSIITRYFK